MPQSRLVSSLSSFLRPLLVVVTLLLILVTFPLILWSDRVVPVVELVDVRSTHSQQPQHPPQPSSLRSHHDNADDHPLVEWLNNNDDNVPQSHLQKPHHTGHVTYVTEISSDRNHLVYKRIFNAPCGYGMLVFNVGPAAVYEPYTYELYEDAYAYSDNDGLCLLYPSYNGVQEATVPLWSFRDEMEMTVPLGDRPTQISTRIVIPPNTKPFNTTDDPNHPYHGGDYLIIREGNFYNPTYYKNVKELINRWPPPNMMISSEEIADRLMELVAVL